MRRSRVQPFPAEGSYDPEEAAVHDRARRVAAGRRRLS
jgi:hypothetical protein